MARIVCLPEFMKHIRLTEDCPHEKLILEIGVNDLFIPQNQGAWLWKITKSGSEFIQESRFISKGKMAIFTIAELTEWLFGYQQPEQVKRLIGVSPQETAVAPNLSVKENLELICGIHGFSKEKTLAKIKELSEQFSLESILPRKAGKLSGGWQRRVSIAMALISEPQILFLDEPTLGLDVIARYELWDVIRELKGKITIILTTHYMEEAQELSDRIGIMKNGSLLAVGTVEELNTLAGCDDFEKAFVSIVKEG